VNKLILIAALALSLMMSLMPRVIYADGNVTGSFTIKSDNVSPAAVTDLAVTAATYTSLTLTWTAPGDDVNVGTAALYDIRYSTSFITVGNWNFATQCSGEPHPQPAGSSESFTVTGLSSGSTYYFALKTADEVLNWSALSNVPSGTTLSGGGAGGWGTGGEGGAWACSTGATSIAGKTTAQGWVLKTIVVKSPDERFRLIIEAGTVARNRYGSFLTCVGIFIMGGSPSPPEDVYIIGNMYDVTPIGATFSPTATLEYSNTPTTMPVGIDEQSLVIASYDEVTGKWIKLDSIVDTKANTVTAKISRLNALAVFGYKVEAPPPAAFQISSLGISPTAVYTGETVNISIQVTNIGGQSGSYQVILKINGVAEADKEVILDAGASTEVSFTIAKETAGIYSVDVNGVTSVFEIMPKPVPPPKPFNWWLIVGIVAAASLAASSIYHFRRQIRYAGVTGALSVEVRKAVSLAPRLALKVGKAASLAPRLALEARRKVGKAASLAPKLVLEVRRKVGRVVSLTSKLASKVTTAVRSLLSKFKKPIKKG